MTRFLEEAIDFEGLNMKDDKSQPPIKKPNSDEFWNLDDPELPVIKDHEFRVKYWRIPHNSFSMYLKYIEEHWHYFNKTKFGGRLKPPQFVLLRDTDAARSKLSGDYRPPLSRNPDDPGRLRIHPNQFNAAHEGWINNTILHEMCHQAVFEIDGPDADSATYKIKKGHGPLWVNWMKHVGLEPNQYDNAGRKTYMGIDDVRREEERQEFQKKVIQERSKRMIVQQPKLYVPVIFLSKKQDDPITGILLGPMASPKDDYGNPKERKTSKEPSWYFLNVADKRVYKASLRTAFYLYPDEAKPFQSAFWREEAFKARERMVDQGKIDPV